MKASNKKSMLDLTKYYKGEDKNPFEKETLSESFWNFEREYFLNPNVFQKPNLEEDFKEAMRAYISHIADYFMAPFNNVLEKYFNP